MTFTPNDTEDNILTSSIYFLIFFFLLLCFSNKDSDDKENFAFIEHALQAIPRMRCERPCHWSGVIPLRPAAPGGIQHGVRTGSPL